MRNALSSAAATSLRSSDVHRLRSWELWSIRTRALTFILGVDVLIGGLTIVALAHGNFAAADAFRAALLVGLSTLFSESADRVDLLRRYLHLGGNDRVWSNPTSVWTFAAALLLPAGYAAVVVLVIYAHILVQSRRHKAARPYRIIFACATTLLGTYIALAVQGLTGIRMEHGAAGAADLLLTLTAYTTVGLAATTAAAYLVRGPPTLRSVLPAPDAVGFEVATLILGVVTAAFIMNWPWLVPAVFVLIAVLQRSTLVKELEVSASTDAKTGLLNSAAWRKVAQRHLQRAKREGSPLAILMVDLDHFKRVNDRFGHMAGDRILKAVADCLGDELRVDDAVGRFGGEEFIVVLDGVEPDVAVQTALRLNQAIGALQITAADHDEPLTITASIGVANYPADGQTMDAVTKAADDALYDAKDAGRDRVRLAGGDRAPISNRRPSPR